MVKSDVTTAVEMASVNFTSRLGGTDLDSGEGKLHFHQAS